MLYRMVVWYAPHLFFGQRFRSCSEDEKWERSYGRESASMSGSSNCMTSVSALAMPKKPKRKGSHRASIPKTRQY